MNIQKTALRLPLLVLLLACYSVKTHSGEIDRRPLDLTIDGEWIGAGVSYGEYHDGQSPMTHGPTIEQVRGDLHTIVEHWKLIRMYGTSNAEKVCEVIREDNLDIKLMVGAWIGTESSPETIESNRSEVANAIRLANAYPDVVIAISIGNETQVDWSGHRVKQETLIGYIRETRVKTSVPVTTCDDYNFWNKPQAPMVEAEIDFIGFHAYAMWNKQTLGNALQWTREQLADVKARFPDAMVVHCETGWATQKHSEGEQATLIIASAGEGEQELFYRAYRAWAEQNQQAHFFFEAFDENWKGGNHPDEVEKHWGLFNSDRSPKQAVE